MKLNGIELKAHDPSAIFKNHIEIKKALSAALMDGDKEAFIEILAGYIRTHNVLKVCQRTKLSRTVVYEAMTQQGNPSLETLCKIMNAFKSKEAA